MDIGTEQIPSPPGLPLIGNLRDLDVAAPIQSINRLAEQHGDIFRLNIVGTTSVFLSSNALVNEVCDEKRFKKNVGSVLKQVRNGVHDGLFTAFGEEEPNWGKAHRILTPAFGPLSIQNMFDDMHDIATQLALKWARRGPSEPIHVTDDFTRLALDTLALCAMDYRFNSFYSEEMHPFISAMGNFLVESGNRSRRPPLPAMFYKAADQQYAADIATMRAVSDGVVNARRAQNPPSERKDLLAAMLSGTDPRTGETLDNASITNNLITFLIAGHETTSGMLSFAFYDLLRHPEAYSRAQQEVDDVCGTGPITVDQLPKLKYSAAVLRETLRLNATIPAVGVTARKDETLAGGKYFVKGGENLVMLLMRAQVDPVVFGDDARSFRPERMLDENFELLNKAFPNCWKPFGNGARACIGRPFAWQEALLVMAMLLQNFNFRFDDASYQLRLKETLTIKPDGFFMRAQLRQGLTPTLLEKRLAGTPTDSSKTASASSTPKNGAAAAAASATGRPLNVYYGSNSGTCEAMANRIAADAPAHGFHADVLAPLDAAHQALPTDGRPVVIVTASYEGEPPDNAGLFVNWLRNGKAGDAVAKGVAYAVFGCGHHDWAQTFHKIPTQVDSQLEVLGGDRLATMGKTDAAEGNMFEDFETWEDTVLFPALKAKYNVGGGDANGKGGAAAAAAAAAPVPDLRIEISTPRASNLRQDVREAVVVAARSLSGEPGEPGRKMHVEIELPTGMTYNAGDYLAILPFNRQASITRAMRRFHLPWDANLTVHTNDGGADSTQTNMPTNTPLPVYGVLGAYVELGQPATKRSILALADVADGQAKTDLQRLASDDYTSEVSAKKVSILDLLDRFPSVDLPFGTFLTLLPPMRVRQYSISSSPLWNANHVTLSYAILTAPALADESRKHVGVASHYLSNLQPGDRIHVAVRPSHASFHLPHDGENVPIVCIAAGTGLAPFRGFIQERAALIGAGRHLAPAHLFFGCRGQADDLYRDELDKWEAQGAVTVHRAYSRQTDRSDETHGCKHVQDRLWHDREDMVELWQQGARVYVCGSRQLGEGVKQTLLRMRQEACAAAGKPETEEETDAWFARIRYERYATDVFD
ncbi:cytochrome P450 [Sporothrix schenckii 1099-18]|uniref:Bifunctional cytochrome P450/NADPH--P450 reductase n=1 Tax=Sporothrix schenckii 1099-18 TaxID=1397361 RepID=A0A0F2M3Q2_SPOSC|nr:cytochrome P450 [Sporothrix schenckii 1099-18]KJR84297.1 cytochrome P450 [Sporothrix schenckii 1099-18]